ncbi:MAG: GTP-binding protein [Nitrospira sp.]|nr:GTP-binding protein [Nitrospira sp.]MBX3368891.1 GTP-binding protein [Nitrospira sp.]MBX7040995.1 GTP-binding protein [Nitrospira sp.]MCW5792813.1 GTP-binding protein [Nitrospira sp.]HMU29254.1 Rab family GTPase [Nitrospira sp.]
MIEKKICMLGAFAVGKTSLVRRFVSSCFSDQYQTTIGVTVDKKSMTVDGTSLTMVLWDLYGEDEFQKLRSSYLRGSSGYLLVLDGMRRATLDIALHVQERASDTLGPVPFVVLINKHDRRAEWDITDQDLAQLAQRGWSVVMSSAKTGQGVEEAFTTLARAMLTPSNSSAAAGRPHGS